MRVRSVGCRSASATQRPSRTVVPGAFRLPSLHAEREHVLFRASGDGTTIPVTVWGTGNMGRAAIRAVAAHPGLELAAVLVLHAGEGRAATPASWPGSTAPSASSPPPDVDAALAAAGAGAVAYTASGDIRPDDALADVARSLRAGAVVVTPALYALYDHRSAPTR